MRGKVEAGRDTAGRGAMGRAGELPTAPHLLQHNVQVALCLSYVGRPVGIEWREAGVDYAMQGVDVDPVELGLPQHDEARQLRRCQHQLEKCRCGLLVCHDAVGVCLRDRLDNLTQNLGIDEAVD